MQSERPAPLCSSLSILKRKGGFSEVEECPNGRWEPPPGSWLAEGIMIECTGGQWEGEWSERLLGGRQPPRSSKQHLLKTWGTSHYSCSLTDRHPGRVGDGAQRGRRGAGWQSVDRGRTSALTFSWQLHSHSTTWGSRTHTHARTGANIHTRFSRRLTELTLKKRRKELRTFVLKQLRLYWGHNQGLQLLRLGLFAPLSSPLLVLLWGLWIRPSWIAGSSSERHGTWTKEPPLGIKPGLL